MVGENFDSGFSAGCGAGCGFLVAMILIPLALLALLLLG